MRMNWVPCRLKGVWCRNGRDGTRQSLRVFLILAVAWPAVLWLLYIGLADPGYGRSHLWNLGVGTVALAGLVLVTPFLAKSFLSDVGVWPRLLVLRRGQVRYGFTFWSVVRRRYVRLDGECARADFSTAEVVTDARKGRALTLWTLSSGHGRVTGTITGPATDSRVARLVDAFAKAEVTERAAA